MQVRHAAALITLLFILLSSPAPAQETTTSEDLAIQAYRQGSFARAVDLYTAALAETEDPEHRARLHVNIAWTLFALGRTDEVGTHLNAALVEHPDLTLVPDYYTDEFMDRFDAARRRVVDGMLSDGTPAPDLEATLATVDARIAEQSDLETALADVDRLLEAYPLDGRLVPIKVQILTMLGRTSDAQDLSRGRADGLMGSGTFSDRMTIPDLILRANRQLESGDAVTALELLRQAVSRQPSNVAALELMAEAAQRSQNWQEAEFALKSALGFQPGNLGLNLRLGEVYLARGDASAARDVFRQLTEDFPRSDRAWAALGLLDGDLGNYEQAARELDTALAENPLLPEVQLALGEILLRDEQPVRALEAFKAAANLLYNDAQVDGRTGQALLALGQNDDALVKLRDATSEGFDEADMQRALGLALIQTGNLAEAERVLTSVGAGSEGDGDVLKALLHLERGEPDEALAILEPIAAKRSGEPAILNLVGVSLYRLQRYADATAVLEQAVLSVPGDEIIEANYGHAKAALTAVTMEASARSTQPFTAN